MDVFFETQNGYTFSIEVGYWDTVLEIKKKIAKYQRFPVSKQTLFFKGKVLLEEDRGIKQLNIIHNSRLQVFVPPPYHNTNHNNDQSPVPSNAIGDIIYGQDFPLTTNHFSNIQAFYPVTTEAITDGQGSLLRNIDHVLLTKQTPPLNSIKEIINIPYSPGKPVKVRSNNNNDQVLQTKQSPPSNSIKEIISIPDSPGKPVKVRSNNKNDQVLQTEQYPPSNSVKEIIMVQDSPMKVSSNKKILMRRTPVFVMPYSGDIKAAKKTPVGVNMSDNVKELRKELVKIQKRGQLKLPKEGFFFIHQKSVMDENRSFCCNGVDPGDIIEIIARESYSNLFRRAL